MEKRTVGLLVAVNLIYVCIGAAVFMALESTNETKSSREILSTVSAFLANHSSCLSSSELQTFIRQVLTAYDNGVFTTNETQSATQWDYSNSLFFAMTVTTTIGYGNQSPVTSGGRIFVIIFALLGIPLTGVMLVGIGEKQKYVVKLVQSKNCTKYKRAESFIKHILLNALIVGLLTLIPAYIFHIVEGWTFEEAVYYSFITLLTIGFGDYVAGTKTDQNYRIIYKILVNLWIYIGLAWFTTIISYFTESYTKYAKKSEDKYKELRKKLELKHENSEVNQS